MFRAPSHSPPYLSADSLPNAAPFAYFNAIANQPPLVMFSPTYQGAKKPGYSGEKVKRDTLQNAEATGEFVVDIVTEEIAQAVSVCSGPYPHVSQRAGEGRIVNPPRVAKSLGSLECKAQLIADLSSHNLATGEVVMVMFHIRDDPYHNGTVHSTGLPSPWLSKN